jgi:predicted permease
MSLSRQLSAGLRTIFRKDAVEHELDDEIKHYIEMATRERMRQGLSRAEAERAVRIQFGGVESAKEVVRTGGWESAVETWWQDFRYALRGLRRNPAFTAVAALTLALGIGANTAMFSVVNAVMLRPLPYHDAGRLALIWTDDIRRGLHTEQTAYRTIGDWRAGNRTLADIAFFNVGRATLANADGFERSRSAFVSGNLFAVLGTSALRGRTVSADDEAQQAPVAVISHALWLRRFGGDSNVIGKTLVLADEGKDGSRPLSIIGVMPPDFYFPDKATEFWRPATTYWRFNRESVERFSAWARRWIGVARVKPGTSLDLVRVDFANIGRRLDLTYTSNVPDFPGFTTNVVPILDSIAGKNLQSTLWLLLASVLLVLLVACANVANLLLARGTTRQHEFALRRALGAGRGRVTRQLIVESLVLAGVGGLLGVVLALGGTRVLSIVSASQLPRADEIGLDVRVLAFALVVSLVAGLVFGVVPALRVTGADASQILKEGGRASGARRLVHTRGVLIVAECALAIVLLAGAGLLLRSLRQLHAVDPGFDSRHVLLIRVEWPTEPPPAANEIAPRLEVTRAERRDQVLRDVASRVAAIPGVQAVGFVDDMYIAGPGNKSITIPSRSADSVGAGQLNDGAVTPGFFATMHVPLRRGRYLTPDDALTKIRALYHVVLGPQLSLAEKARLATAEPVVVNEAFARRFFPNEDPIGQRFCIDPTNKTYWYEIVGVVGDMRRQGLEQAPIPEFFGPYIPWPLGRTDLVVRVAGDPVGAAGTIRQVIATSVPRVIIASVDRADRQLGAFSAQRSLQTWLLTSFAVLALALAAIGIYGVVHYAVAERTREIGVRVALGASAPDVLRLVVAKGMRLPILGIAIGLGAALALSRVMTRLLFGTPPTDPVTYGAVALTLSAVALYACYLPARRAARVDPVVALRSE